MNRTKTETVTKLDPHKIRESLNALFPTMKGEQKNIGISYSRLTQFSSGLIDSLSQKSLKKLNDYIEERKKLIEKI